MNPMPILSNMVSHWQLCKGLPSREKRVVEGATVGMIFEGGMGGGWVRGKAVWKGGARMRYSCPGLHGGRRCGGMTGGADRMV